MITIQLAMKLTGHPLHRSARALVPVDVNAGQARAIRGRVSALCGVLVLFLLQAAETLAHGPLDATLDSVAPEFCANPAVIEPWPDRYLNFETPQCRPITLDPQGRVWVVDPVGNNVVMMSADGRRKRVIPVGIGPAGLAMSPNGSELYVTNHLSDSVSVVDVQRGIVTGVIQQVDPDTRLSILDEPCGVAFSPTAHRAYVTASESNRLAVIDTESQTVIDWVDISAEDPRAVDVSHDGRFIYVAAFESGNATEIMLESTLDLPKSGPLWWYGYLTNTLISLFSEEGRVERIRRDLRPQAPDNDLFVLDARDLSIVSRIRNVGTILYDIALTHDGNAVWVANTDHRNFLNGPDELDGRPILNQLTRVGLGSSNWTDVARTFVSLDEIPAAVPSAITETESGNLLVTAASSDLLMLLNPDGQPIGRARVGSIPRGVATRGNRAWVYNRGDLTVSIVDLNSSPAEVARIPFATERLPSAIAEGRRHFYSARFSSNKTFSCASCHPSGHVDQLVWDLGDGARTTMTVRGLKGTEGFHWDGSKESALQLVNDGVSGQVFRGRIDPCDAEEMASFILNVAFPPSPHRSPLDMMSPKARDGSAIVRRGLHLNASHQPVLVQGEPIHFDPAFDDLIRSIGGPNVQPSAGEGCTLAGCHEAPLWTVGPTDIADSGSTDGRPIQPVTFRGMWDRHVWIHDGRSNTIDNLRATNEYLKFFGYAPSYPGFLTAAAASSGFFTTFFRHEWDTINTETGMVDPLVFHSRIEAYMRELSTGVPGALGRYLHYDRDLTDEEWLVLNDIVQAAIYHKVELRVRGHLDNTRHSWTWVPEGNQWLTDDGRILTREQAGALINAAEIVSLGVSAMLPADTSVQPLLETIVLEGSERHLATARNGEVQTFIFQGENFRPGMRILVDGFGYRELDVIDEGTARHTEFVNAPGPYYIISVLNPNGLQSNEFPVPVVGPFDPNLVPTLEAENHLTPVDASDLVPTD